MDTKDVIISPVGVEDPNIHTISVNGILYNVAIELQLITLVGASVISVNSEYRQFNLDTRIIKKLLKYDTDNKQANKLFQRVKLSIESKMKKDVLNYDKVELKNIAYNGIDYVIVYYLLLRGFAYTEENFVTLNQFTAIGPLLSVFDKILRNDNISLTAVDLKTFADYITIFGDNNTVIGSKLLCLTRYQIRNTNDLSQTIWKSMYINRIIRNIPLSVRHSLFSPSIGWGIIRCVAKHVFTNDRLIDKVSFGENINYIRSAAHKQSQLATKLSAGQLHSSELNNIKKLASELNQATTDIDYALGDLIFGMFYANKGKTLFNESNAFIEESRTNRKVASSNTLAKFIVNHESFKQLILQYLFSVLLLAKHGIIHNDPHLNNMLLTKLSSPKRIELQIAPGKTIVLDSTDVELTVIDFDKSILSHHHHNHFDKTSRMINEEMGIVFDEVKKTIADNYDQIFNCYVMYDVVKFGLIMKNFFEDMDRIVGDILPKNAIATHLEFLEKMIKLATGVLHKIYDPTPKFAFDYSNSHGSIEWLIMTMYGTQLKVNKTKSSMSRTLQSTKLHSSISDDRIEYISSRRKYTDMLKYNFIAQYASELK